ncbi:unnamed protein product [Heligmosomoides polygyrus]|uniref:NR LBD domain-containing protein n=1 Tax=Heligmosomoides polygyrus TaxID=6339 RepID=A0A183GF90_HELPZ|nr:unnamed protein product [Heligmosomoides polygyrus]
MSPTSLIWFLDSEEVSLMWRNACPDSDAVSPMSRKGVVYSRLGQSDDVGLDLPGLRRQVIDGCFQCERAGVVKADSYGCTDSSSLDGEQEDNCIEKNKSSWTYMKPNWEMDNTEARGMMSLMGSALLLHDKLRTLEALYIAAKSPQISRKYECLAVTQKLVSYVALFGFSSLGHLLDH